MKKFGWLWIALGALVLVGAGFLLFKSRWLADYRLGKATVWAQNASEKNFKTLRPGDTQFDVLSRLGYPIDTKTVPFEEGHLWGATNVVLEPYARGFNLAKLSNQVGWHYAVFAKDGLMTYYRGRAADGKRLGPLVDSSERIPLEAARKKFADFAETDAYRIEEGELMIYTEKLRSDRTAKRFKIRRVYLTNRMVAKIIARDGGATGLAAGLREGK